MTGWASIGGLGDTRIISESKKKKILDKVLIDIISFKLTILLTERPKLKNTLSDLIKKKRKLKHPLNSQKNLGDSSFPKRCLGSA